VTIAAFIVAQALVTVCIPRGPLLTFLTDSNAVILTALGAFAAIRNAVHSSSRLRLFWSLQAASYLSLLTSVTLWTGYEILLRQEAPNPFVGDVFLFIAGVPVVASLLLEPHAERDTRLGTMGVIDFGLLLVFWLHLYLFFVIPWQYVSLNEARYGGSYNTLDGIQNVLIVLIVGALAFRSGGIWRRFYAWLAVAQAVSAVADQIANSAIDAHAYYPGSWQDLPYIASLGFSAYVLMRGAGLQPENTPSRPLPGFISAGPLAIAAVLSLPLMACWAFLEPNAIPAVSKFRILVTLAAIFVMATLAFVKQGQLGRELGRMNQVLQEASITDPLTGARNRRFFDETIRADVDHVLRSYADQHDQQTRDLVFYLIDADNFKDVNDWFGHSVGDKVLMEISRRISTAIRNSDVLVRWGGEEFLVVSRYTNRSEAEILASRVLIAVGGAPFCIEGIEQPITQKCSIGWAVFPFLPEHPDAVGHEEVLSLADRALYVAKSQGRNRAVGMSPSKDFRFDVVPAPRVTSRSQLPVEVLLTAGPA
jgi:diguanylate cyclase (GGDEF)-like protein